MNKRSRITKGLSHRLIAVLLCCVCLLAASPVYAIASEADPAPAVEEAAVEKAVETPAEPETPENPEVPETPAPAGSGERAEPAEETSAPTVLAADPQANKVPVHVYVSSTDSNGNSWRNNTEFQNLIGLYVCDQNGYFPAGTIYLEESYFTGKGNAANTSGTGLINDADDWETLLGLLSNMNNNNLSGTLGARWASNGKTLDFSNNNGNKVSEYLSQAEEIYNRGWGSHHTALFRWHKNYDANDAGTAHLGHPGDNTTNYHLDLCFNTNKITFICGNNGITQAVSQVAYDGREVDSRVYITGFLIQQPRNLEIPAGYQLIGYYTDPDFNTPWNGIGTPLNEDQKVYIKITEKENIVLNYKVAEGQGAVDPANEAFNPDTGKPAGSTATPASG